MDASSTCPTLEIAVRAARAGGAILREYASKGFAIHSKGGVDIVSDADFAAERKVVEVIRAACPEHHILAEEEHAAAVTEEHLWIVDPLDGTINYAHGIPHYAVSIAYYFRGEPVCGAIYNPARDELYTAVKGEGAFAPGGRTHVTPATQLNEVLIGIGFYYDRGQMMEATLAAIGDVFRQQIRGVRRCGTAALDLVQVGLGYYGGYFEYQLSPWDFAAGRLFVEEAGGRVTTARGDELPLAVTSILATNGVLHAPLKEITARHHL